jgi:hypothetical protein
MYDLEIWLGFIQEDIKDQNRTCFFDTVVVKCNLSGELPAKMHTTTNAQSVLKCTTNIVIATWQHWLMYISKGNENVSITRLQRHLAWSVSCKWFQCLRWHGNCCPHASTRTADIISYDNSDQRTSEQNSPGIDPAQGEASVIDWLLANVLHGYEFPKFDSRC